MSESGVNLDETLLEWIFQALLGVMDIRIIPLAADKCLLCISKGFGGPGTDNFELSRDMGRDSVTSLIQDTLKMQQERTLQWPPISN